MVVGNGPEHDLTACQFRKVVQSHGGPNDPDVLKFVASISFGGSIEPIGAGLVTVNGMREDASVKFPSLLGPRLLSEVLSAVELDAGTGTAALGAASAGLQVDRGLGVCLVEVFHDDPAARIEIARSAAAAVGAEEALIQSRHLAQR